MSQQTMTAGGLNDTAMMLGRWRDRRSRVGASQGSERADFVSAHQSRVPGDIGRQHRRQSLFHALPGHEAPVG